MQLNPSQCRTENRRQAGFTLVEMLVVVGIIAVLVAIILPTVNAVKRAAQTASTRAMMQRIVAGCEAYSADHRAYPGPFANAQLYPFVAAATPMTLTDNSGNNYNMTGTGTVPNRNRVTSTENLFLGLAGALWFDSSTGQFQYRPSPMPPAGVAGLNGTVSRKVYSPYITFNINETSAGTLNDIEGGPGATPDGSWCGTVPPLVHDTNVPEFLDKYSSPMPILYMRANVGAKYFYSDRTVYDADSQYQIAQVVRQYSRRSGSSNGLVPWTIYTKDYPATTAPNNYDQVINGASVNIGTTQGAYNYFGTISGGTNTPIPLKKDSYILISAGADNTYGTKDDVVNFR